MQNDEAMILFLLLLHQIWKGLGEVLTVLCYDRARFFSKKSGMNSLVRSSCGVEYLDWCFKSFMVCRMSEINFIWLSYVVQFIYTVIIYKPITYTIYIPILNFFWRENNLIFTRCLNDLHKRFKTWPQKVHELLYLKICLLCFFFKVNRF